MATALRPSHIRLGPALTGSAWPTMSMTVSTALHVGVVLAILVSVHTFAKPQPKPLVVALVPAVAAIGSPRGDAAAPPEPTVRPEPTAPKPEPVAAPPPVAPKVAPAPKAQLPAAPPRPLPPMPTRALPSRDIPRDALPLADPNALVQRSTAAALPRFERREMPALPTTTSTTARNPLPPSPLVSKATAPSAPSASPALPLGRADGSVRGSGAVTVDGDFPFGWYIAAIQRKISERWHDKAQAGRQPTVVFEIGRDGQISLGQLAVEQTSGNQRYDRMAMRAIEDAKPFPPLPTEFPAQLLRIHVSFAYIGDGVR